MQEVGMIGDMKNGTRTTRLRASCALEIPPATIVRGGVAGRRGSGTSARLR